MGRVRFYFPQLTILSEENYLYTTLTLLAEIGGYLGLLLGVSFLNIVDWVQRFLQDKIDKQN